MKTINLIQGSPEWHEHRSNHFNASDAPAMMGASKYASREQLLKRLATGITEEVSASTQALFDKGHRAEAAVRPHIEAAIGEELFPTVGVSDDYQKLSASFDGITIDDNTIFECKLWNEELVAAVRANDLPAHYYWQLEQQLLVSGASRAIFVVSREDGSEFESYEYRPVEGRREQLIAGWKQFGKDLAEFKPEAPKAEVVGKSIAALPSLSIQLVGEVKASNLAVYKSTALDFIRSINTKLETDQHFADAENVIKFCDRAEKELEVVKKAALGQTASIDELFRTVDDLKDAMRAKRLELEKLVKARKEAIRVEIVAAANVEFGAYGKEQADRLGGRVPAPAVRANFAEAIKGKKTITGLRDGINEEMARAKIELAISVDKLVDSLAAFDAAVGEYGFLFRDLASLVSKDAEAVTAIVSQRISEHKQAEEKRLEAERAAQAAAATKTEEVVTPSPLVKQQNPQTVPQTVVKSEALTASVSVMNKRPTDWQMVEVLAVHFLVHESKVVEWLGDLDIDALNNKITEEFV